MKVIDKFKKHVKFEELAKIDDSYKFMHKAYLKFKLLSGKAEICYMYAVGSVIDGGFCNKEDSALKDGMKMIEHEKETRVHQIIDLFEKTMREGFWTTDEHDTKYFWGEEQVWADKDGKMPEYDRVETTKKTTTFIFDKNQEPEFRNQETGEWVK